jgi:pyruvate dehydrogenase E1 component alpha subunit
MGLSEVSTPPGAGGEAVVPPVVSPASAAQADVELMYRLHRQMLLLRRFEERAGQLYGLGKIGGFCHLYIGEEAVAVGAISCLRPPRLIDGFPGLDRTHNDYVITSYRDHGYPLVLGSDPGAVMAELYGKAAGLVKGKGGSMHMFDARRGLLGGYGIVGGQIPLATGTAFAQKYHGTDAVTLCFLGEAAVQQGVFHESLNMAALWKLPVIYIVENNRYGMGTSLERATNVHDLTRKALAYDMPAHVADGMDVMKMREVVGAAVTRAREEKRATFIEARTYRFRGHSMSDPVAGHYRTKDEVEEQKKRDPLNVLKTYLERAGGLDEKRLELAEDEVRAQVQKAVDLCESSPWPDDKEAFTDVYAGE